MPRTSLAIVAFCAVLAASRAFGQVEDDWRTRFGTVVPAREAGRSVAVDPAGNVFAGGWVEASELSDPTGVLVKYDASGGEQWSEEVGEGEIVKVGLDAAGNLFAAGSMGRQQGLFVRKHDPAGRLLWSVKREVQAEASDLAVSPAGEAHVSGTRRGVDDVFLVLKVDPTGNVLWESEYNGPRPREGSDDDGYNDRTQAMALDASGNVYVTGISRAEDNRWEYATVKLSPAGKLLWARRFRGSEQPEWSYAAPRAIAVDSQGNVVVTGAAASRQGDGNPEYDFGTVKYDSQGNQLWSALHAGREGMANEASALAIDPAGNVIITGTSTSTDFPRGIATVKFDRDGKFLWERHEEITANNYPRLTLAPEGMALVVVSAGVTERSSRFVIFRYGPGGERLGEKQHDPPVPGLREVSQAVLDVSGNLVAVATAGEYQVERLALLKSAQDGSLLWTAGHNGAGFAREQPVALAIDRGGNICLAGWISSPPTDTDFAELKLDPLGGVLHSSRWAGPRGGIDRPSGMAIDSDGNIVITGHSTDARAGADYLTLKYGPDGSLLWDARYDSAGGIWSDSAQAVAIDSTGAVYVTGGSDGGTPDILTIKYTPHGEEVWKSRYDEPKGGTQSAVAMALDAQGGIFLAGHAFVLGDRYLLTLKLDGQGNTVWASQYMRGPGSNLARALVLDRGSALVLGSSKDERGKDDYAVLKYDGSGGLEWSAHFNGPKNGQDSPAAIAVDAEGNVYVTGTSEQDFATVKYSPDGGLVWSAIYDGPFGGEDRATALAVDAAGRLYVGGISGSADDRYEQLVLRYGQGGDLLWEYGSEAVRGLWGPLPVLTLAAPGELIVAGAVVDQADATDFVIYKLLDRTPSESPRFIRGDSNADGAVDVSDAARTLGYLFLGDAAPDCLDAADGDDDGRLDISDPVGVIQWLFLGGTPLPLPAGAPGSDPTPDALGCARGV